MTGEEVTEKDGVLDEFDDKWSNPEGSYYYCIVLPNGDVEYVGTKGGLRNRLDAVYNGD